jgi:micrococcal nuclease
MRCFRSIVAALLLPLTGCAEAQVLTVVDGDTFQVSGRAGPERIRIENIDAPELRGARCPEERALAVKAADALAAILKNGVSIQRHGKDRFGRTLALVSSRGRDVGQALIDAGLAERWTGRRRDIWCGR